VGGVNFMSRQTMGQRWCSLVLLAVFLSLFLYHGLPATAYRIGRAIEAGRRDANQEIEQPSPGESFRDERAAPFVRATQDVRAAVVHIDAVHQLESSANGPAGDPSEAARPWQGGELRISRGCGVVVDPQGLVLTCSRVVSGAAQVRIFLPSHEKPFLAKLAGSDAGTDLALLSFSPPPGGVTAAQIPSAGKLEIGEYVVAVGNAYRPGEFLWVGVVNSPGRRASPACCDPHDCIQTAAINLWNCGAPLVNLQGAIVGINTSLREADDFPAGLAIPASTAREVVAQLRTHGEVRRGWLGVFIHKASPTPELPPAANLPEGALAVAVDYVVPGSPAEQGGLRAGDVIVRFGGSPFYSAAELRRRIAGASLQSTVPIRVLRAARIEEPQVVIGPPPATPPQLPGEKEWGMQLLGHLSAEESGRLFVDGRRGVIVQEVEPRCKVRGLAPRDVILSVNGVATPDLEAFCREVNRLCEAQIADHVRLEVSTNGSPRQLVIGDE
jgi:serine protease Do